jgi:hypothetical protein
MRKRTLAISLGIAGLGGLVFWISLPTEACYGISDREAVENIIRDYNSEPLSARSGPADVNMKLSPKRVVGIGRTGYPRGEGNLTQVWFRQDDGTLTVTNYYEDCALKFGRAAANDISNAAYPVHAPTF